MADSINKVILVGNVGAPPKSGTAKNGYSYANISIATNEYNRKTKSQETTWHRVASFGEPADIIINEVSKGSKVYVEGKLTISKYVDQETGEEKISHQVLAKEVMVMQKSSAQHKIAEPKNPYDQSEWGEMPDYSKPTQKKKQKQKQKNAPVIDYDNEDIPF